MKKLDDDLDISEYNHKVILDLIFAGGGQDELIPHPQHPNEPDRGFISRRGLEILALVWHGECSVYEVIGTLDKAIKKHQEQR